MRTGEYSNGHASALVTETTAVPPRMRDRIREVASLYTTEQHRSKGYATTLMHHICKEADKANFVLVLSPRVFGDLDGHGALGQSYLEAWYESSFGFQLIQHQPVKLMARMPGATPRLELKPVDAIINSEYAK